VVAVTAHEPATALLTSGKKPAVWHYSITTASRQRTWRGDDRERACVTDEFGKCLNGYWCHDLLGMLPLVGAVGDYFGEGASLRKVRKRGVLARRALS
jgi:hypothetical protein